MEEFSAVFFPLEITKREYISRVLMATYLADKGIPSVVGHKTKVFKIALAHDVPGTVFYKSAGPKNVKIWEKFRDRGFSIVAQDEEAGVVHLNFSTFYESRPSLHDIPAIDRFFLLGIGRL